MSEKVVSNGDIILRTLGHALTPYRQAGECDCENCKRYIELIDDSVRIVSGIYGANIEATRKKFYWKVEQSTQRKMVDIKTLVLGNDPMEGVKA